MVNKIIVHNCENGRSKFLLIQPEKWKMLKVPSINWIHENIGVDLSLFSIKELTEIMKNNKNLDLTEMTDVRLSIVYYMYNRFTNKRLSKRDLIEYLREGIFINNDMTLIPSIYTIEYFDPYEITIPELGINLKELFINFLNLTLYEDPNVNDTSYRSLYINENYKLPDLDLTL